MSLSNLIRKRDTGGIATAIPAIPAIQTKVGVATVARIATIAVANPQEEKTAVDAASTWWLLHYPNRDPVEMACSPPATHADILERHPDAVAAEPFTPTIIQPSAPMTAGEQATIRAWLALIGETDPATIAVVIGQCQQDADARDYFIGQAAAELPKPDPHPDDRRTCDQCANLIARRCQAAKRGEIVASRNYEPIRNLPRRCEGYAPGATDPDRRPGRERWLPGTRGNP